MSSLYELTNNLKELMFMIDENDGTFSDECLLDTWESLDGAFDDKVENWCKCIKSIERDIEAAKSETDRLKSKIKKDENKVMRMKSVMAALMMQVDKPKIRTALFNVNRLKLNGKLDIDSVSSIPDEYKKEVVRSTKEADKEKIRETLEKGENLPFARFYNSLSIQ